MTTPLGAREGAGMQPGFAGPAPVRTEAMREEVLRGLRSQPKTLPPKLFYDVAGAALFERITALPEYYLTRAELEILRARIGELAALAGPRCSLVEYGSGAGTKVRLLLDALEDPVGYVPIDIAHEQLAAVGAGIAADYPALAVRPLAADYTAPLRLPAMPPAERRKLAFFPGSTIGNFHPTEAAAFLQRVRRAIGPDGALILGVDRRKDAATLEAAYNDREGITAQFNLNMLVRLNRELGARFQLRAFAHRALWNDRSSRIEMHLVSRARQAVPVGGLEIQFERGETIWTESSYKYDRPRLDRLVAEGGFRWGRLFTDPEERFWVGFLVVAG